MRSGEPCLTKVKFCWTAPAVPSNHSASLRAVKGVIMRTPPVKSRFRSQGPPEPICSISDWGRYWASTITSKILELTQFESGKSIIRYLPAKGTAGLVRLAVRALNRAPSPPARMMARVFIFAPSLPDKYSFVH